jgi:hypothetical protein
MSSKDWKVAPRDSHCFRDPASFDSSTHLQYCAGGVGSGRTLSDFSI